MSESGKISCGNPDIRPFSLCLSTAAGSGAAAEIFACRSLEGEDAPFFAGMLRRRENGFLKQPYREWLLCCDGLPNQLLRRRRRFENHRSLRQSSAVFGPAHAGAGPARAGPRAAGGSLLSRPHGWRKHFFTKRRLTGFSCRHLCGMISFPLLRHSCTPGRILQYGGPPGASRSPWRIAGGKRSRQARIAPEAAENIAAVPSPCTQHRRFVPRSTNNFSIPP